MIYHDATCNDRDMAQGNIQVFTSIAQDYVSSFPNDSVLSGFNNTFSDRAENSSTNVGTFIKLFS